MRSALVIVAALAGLSATTAADALTIGVSAPLSGPSAMLGRQVEAGARLAAAASGVSVKVADDACTAAGGAAAAKAFAAAKVDAVVGFLCSEAIDAALPILKTAGITAITVGVRTDRLTDKLANGRRKTDWPVLRLAPRGDAERQAATAMVTRLWRNDFFAIVDDGTIYGRQLAEAVRAGAEQSGLKPVFVDTFRPAMDNQIGLVGRLRKAGATHVFVGGDGSDLAVMARDAHKLGADMVFAGGESLRIASGDVPYAQGTLMVALPEWSDVADKAALDAFAAAKIVPEGYALPAYAAIEIAAEAGTSARLLAEALKGHDFATAIGTIRFNGNGDLAQNPYRVFRFDGQRFVPLEEK
jgi:branched-chain amino acid transport system substrate-binding protein